MRLAYVVAQGIQPSTINLLEKAINELPFIHSATYNERTGILELEAQELSPGVLVFLGSRIGAMEAFDKQFNDYADLLESHFDITRYPN